jgi:hypothetical protein
MMVNPRNPLTGEVIAARPPTHGGDWRGWQRASENAQSLDFLTGTSARVRVCSGRCYRAWFAAQLAGVSSDMRIRCTEAVFTDSNKARSLAVPRRKPGRTLHTNVDMTDTVSRWYWLRSES